MWYLILVLLFGQGGKSTHTYDNPGQSTMQTNNDTDDTDGGDTSTPIPPRPPRP